jgi:hypothetical protein
LNRRIFCKINFKIKDMEIAPLHETAANFCQGRGGVSPPGKNEKGGTTNFPGEKRNRKISRQKTIQ